MKNLQAFVISAIGLPAPALAAIDKYEPHLHLRSRQNATNSHWQRRLTPIRCDSVGQGTCFVKTPRSFSSNATFTPGSFLGPNGTSIQADVNSLNIQSEMKCDVLYCRMSFSNFKLLEVIGTLLSSDISIDVETLYVMQGGEISGSGQGYVAGDGPSPGWMNDLCICPPCGARGAGHGGKGGYVDYTPGQYGIQVEGSPQYGIEDKPVTLGSGGTNTNGGGRIYISATDEVKIDGIISENGDDCKETTYCVSASGGSVYIESDKVLGAGSITANGGALPEYSADYVATGAGGRIAIRHNELSPTLTIEVSGGVIGDDLPDYNQGEQGTFYPECLSSTCFNGGEKTGDCGCECFAPWSGPDCSLCPLDCKNGAQVDEESCTCICEPEWTGPDCGQCSDEFLCNSNGACSVSQQSKANVLFGSSSSFSCSCNNHFYGESCETYCHPLETCGGNGSSCSDDGKSCVCAEGKVGDDCSCEKLDCSAANACSGNGLCTNSMCECIEGFMGCDCSIQCLASVDCSGNGSCNRDGTCSCTPGFSGSNCAEQDIDSYCSNAANTITGLPCLPLINDRLGYGFNAINGEATIPVLGMLYTEGRKKTIRGQNYELPDNVDCEEVTTSDVNLSTQEFDSVSTYQSDTSEELGLSGTYQNVYLSANYRYKDIKRELDTNKKRLYQSDLVHGSFLCRFRNQAYSASSVHVRNALSTLTGDRLVEHIGTHYIHEVTIGGRIRVLNFVSGCVFQQVSGAEVQKQIEGSFYSVAGAAASAGYLGWQTSNGEETGCDVIARNTNFEKIVDGGKRELLTNPSAQSVGDLEEWFGSLVQSPGTIKMSVKDVSPVVPSIVEDLDAYIASFVLPETREFDEMSDTVTCDCPTPSSVTSITGPPPETNWALIVGLSSLGLVLLGCGCLYCAICNKD